MKKIVSLLFVLFSISKIASAQIVICDTMPINYNPSTIEFYTAPSSFGDSVLTIDITNNTNTNFAYPLAKLEPVGMWPAGMTLTTGSQGWNVFGSSWNTGQTNTCPFFFNVTQPIPQDFMFSFNLYLSNFSPLAIDSCVFTNTITIYLNPSLSLAPSKTFMQKPFSFLPNPAKQDVKITFQNQGSRNEVSLYDMNGRLLKTYDTDKDELIIHVSRMESGVYYLVSKNSVQKEKLVIIK